MSPAGSRARSAGAGDFVDATTPAVRDILTAMVDVVLSEGGRLHPGLRLVERDGDMTVRCELGDEGGPGSDADGGVQSPAGGGVIPLFDVPRELLIPVTGAQWADDRTQLRLLEPPPGLTPLQRDVLDLHIELYNATGKIPWLVENHPRAALVDQPEMVAAIQALRPGFGQEWQPAAETFLSTRVFGLRPADAPGGPVGGGAVPVHAGGRGEAASNATGSVAQLSTGEGAGSGSPTPGSSVPDDAPPAKTSVLMTLIDLLNHHPRGAPYEVDARAMTTRVARASGTDECFATYGGRRDVIDLALQYGYVDRNTDFAHCAAVTVEVDGIGRIKVLGRRLPKASPLDPPRVRRTEDGLVLSHLTFSRKKPEAFHVPLRMAVQGAGLQRGMDVAAASRAADQAVEAIVRANLDLLEAIAEATDIWIQAKSSALRADESLPAKGRSGSAAAPQAVSLVANSARTQAVITTAVTRSL